MGHTFASELSGTSGGGGGDDLFRFDTSGYQQMLGQMFNPENTKITYRPSGIRLTEVVTNYRKVKLEVTTTTSITTPRRKPALAVRFH